MPKKTKKEKLLAQHHRTNLPLVSSSITTDTFRLRIPINQVLERQNAISVSVNEFTAIKHDLVKTLSITIAIIISEFLLAHYLPH